jgi:hypothetical protein
VDALNAALDLAFEQTLAQQRARLTVPLAGLREVR